MTKRSKDDSVGPWARDKLEALRAYLNFYTTVLKNQGHWLKGTIFVDAFAGPGLSRIRSSNKPPTDRGLFEHDEESDKAETEFLKGSPRVALEIPNPFSNYVFVERDQRRLTELRALRNEYLNQRIDVRAGDASSEIQAWLQSGIDWRHHRAVVFLDPFGMQVPWSTIESLGRTKAIEVIVNFPLGMAIQRLLKKTGDIPVGWQLSLDTFFGSPGWRPLTYEEESDLFGQKRKKSMDSGVKLLEWYRSRLRSVFGYVSTARLVSNTRGNPLYYLIWAGPNKRGLQGADHILGTTRRRQR
jgi:three-Cys-motif partner protein